MKITDDQFMSAYNALVAGSGERVEQIVLSLPPVLAALAGPEKVQCAQVESVEVDDVSPRVVHWTIVAATPSRILRLRVKTPQSRNRETRTDAELLEPACSWTRSTISCVTVTEVFVHAGNVRGEEPEAEASWVIKVAGEEISVPTERPYGSNGREAVSRLITELLEPKEVGR